MAMSTWKHLFTSNESPYISMFRAGCMGIPIEECICLCDQLVIPLRAKDIEAWKDGYWKFELRTSKSILNPKLKPLTNSDTIIRTKLNEFEQWPSGWIGTDLRWFPCSGENIPLQKWGYNPETNQKPILYDRPTAQALSEVGWVAQNLYAQPFIVIDIDGVGHGETDFKVMQFGDKFRKITEVWEDPNKIGSFHLYFNTQYQIPIGHYNYAKLDLMGNQTNTAVYTKNKVSNGIERATLTEDIWIELQEYVKGRKVKRTERKTHGT